MEPFGVLGGEIWGYFAKFGVYFDSFCCSNDSEVIFESFWSHFGVILGTFLEFFGLFVDLFRTFWGFWGHVEVILPRFGSILTVFA